jgi:hypothetical protein
MKRIVKIIAFAAVAALFASAFFSCAWRRERPSRTRSTASPPT